MRLQKDHPLDDKCAQRFIKPRRRGGPPDAIELLKQAHRNIETWFAEFEKA
jgi:hypothetical protein